MPTDQEILTELGDIVSRVMGEQLPEPLNEEWGLGDDPLRMDSLDHVDLIMRVESHFQVDISDEDAEDMRTVGDIVIYLSEVL